MAWQGCIVVSVYCSPMPPKAGSPAQSAKGPPEGSTSQTPSGEKKDMDREDVGTPTSSAEAAKSDAKPLRPRYM